MNKMSELIPHIMDAGFPLDRSSIIHLFVGGSQLHGAKVSGYDDLDIYGCYVETRANILGLLSLEHFVWSSGSQERKNTADDVDVTLYSLHRWGELLLKGNPAIIHYLFAANQNLEVSTWTEHILPHREKFITRKAAEQYLGFSTSQRMRLTGERGMGRHGQRPDLVEKYGYDVKFAMHYVRLLYECRELLAHSHVTLPRPSDERQHLIDIRTGKYTQDEVFKAGDDLRSECESLLANSLLPENVDKEFLSHVIAQAYESHWAQYPASR
jgi:predicted nucleotidyltransferase